MVFVRVTTAAGTRSSPWSSSTRDQLRVEIRQHLATLDITLVDTEHDARLELEAKRLGTLGAKTLLELMKLSDQHLEDDEDERAVDAE